MWNSDIRILCLVYCNVCATMGLTEGKHSTTSAKHIIRSYFVCWEHVCFCCHFRKLTRKISCVKYNERDNICCQPEHLKIDETFSQRKNNTCLCHEANHFWGKSRKKRKTTAFQGVLHARCEMIREYADADVQCEQAIRVFIRVFLA